jgi:hypothetical protein
MEASEEWEESEAAWLSNYSTVSNDVKQRYLPQAKGGIFHRMKSSEQGTRRATETATKMKAEIKNEKTLLELRSTQ